MMPAVAAVPRRSVRLARGPAPAGALITFALGAVLLTVLAVCPAAPVATQGAVRAAPDPVAAAYEAEVRPLVGRYCVGCHSAEKHKGGLDLERFGTAAAARRDLKAWQMVSEMVEAGEMPPEGKPQPTGDERRRLVAWARGMLDAEARARAGDPGRVPLRRLSNAEYDYTVRDLTGVDLRPAREFPADGAAGEGFTNAAEALTEVSPALLNKYLLAARDVAAHAVLLPDGFRFSAGKTRRDWSDESVAELRKFYAPYAPDGRLTLQPYLAATLRHRDDLLAGRATPGDVAAKESLNPKYLSALWQALTDDKPSYPLDAVRTRWRQAGEKDAAALAADIAGWQAKVWKAVPIGSYRFGDGGRQVPNDATIAAPQTLRLAANPAPGGGDLVMYLSARDLFPTGRNPGPVVWGRPRLEGANQSTLVLRDYPTFGPAYEVDYPAAFADAAKYLGAAAEAAGDPSRPLADVAKAARLDAGRLARWVDVLSIKPPGDREATGREVPAVPMTLLGEKTPPNEQRPAVNGWRFKGADLPVLVTNASDKEEHIPGRAAPHAVVVHPTPTEFVAAVWTSPVEGTVRVEARVAHAHPSCGNGVAWWLERRRADGAAGVDRAAVLAEGTVDLGKEARVPEKMVKVVRGDRLVLAIDARDGNHSCDLTEIALTIAESKDAGPPGRTWDLARDVADNVLDGNPHADRFGNRDVWSFVKGPTRPVAAGSEAADVIPAGSLLARWREAAADPTRRAEAGKLAEQAQALLSGPPPKKDSAKDKGPDQALYDRLVAVGSPVLQGADLSGFRRKLPAGQAYGLGAGRFGGQAAGQPVDDVSVAAPAGSVVEARLPAALLQGREFVVDARLGPADTDRAVRFNLSTTPPAAGSDGDGPVIALPGGDAHKRLAAGLEEFRRTFPLFVCFPQVIPTDETVCLKMYHREDEPLTRLFLDDAGRRRIDRLWAEHRLISRQPVAENEYLPLFIGFVTQDQPKELVAYFEGLRPTFKKRADEFEADWEAAAPKQLEALADFAAKAYRRPLRDGERADLLALYRGLRGQGVSHEDAFRGVLARVLVAPSFLFKLEHAPGGKDARPVDDWELATRLSYFLWSSIPDDELRAAAAAGRLHDPDELSRQALRMLKDDRVRALGVEFGAQSIHVRGFDALKDKSEKLFPGFDDKLRAAIYEESILFFQDLFQQDRPVTRLLDADYTYLNDTLAAHYGIPGVAGPQWRRVEGVRKYGRGGVLGLASVQATQAGASRTSPVLRGNWVLETLLGEKLPRPPPDVPKLPEQEGAGGLTTRQMVEKHTSVESCRVCHQRIDPIGFSLERYDPIGRLRDRESTGRPVDCRARLKDGTEFEGIDGLREYLLAKKKDLIVRLFCRRLLGYALGRSVTVSDQFLLDDMVAALDRNSGRLSAAVMEIVRSPQFRNVRGSDFSEDD